jgi:hypothetical protein
MTAANVLYKTNFFIIPHRDTERAEITKKKIHDIFLRVLCELCAFVRLILKNIFEKKENSWKSER